MSLELSMGKIGKTSALFLTLIIALSCLNLLTFKPANAQTIVKSEIPKPAIPQFNVTLYDSSYEIPTPYDPYYWEHFTRPVTYNGARTLVFTIQNQVFTPFQYKDANNNVFNVNLYYNIRYKGHFNQSQDWSVLFGQNFGYIQPASGPQTVYVANGSYGSEFDVLQWSIAFPADAQIDFQVEALIGYPTNPTIFIGQESGWSNTQTVSLNETVTSLPSILPQIYSLPLPSPTSTPTVPELSWLSILPLLVSVFSVAVIVRHRKTANLGHEDHH